MIGVVHVPLLSPPPVCFQALERENFTFLLKFTYSVNYWPFFTGISDPIPIATSGKSCHMRYFGKIVRV